MDLNEFIRKLSWKVYFSIYPTTETQEEVLHANLRVKSNKYPDMAPPPLLDEIKNKVIGWVYWMGAAGTAIVPWPRTRP